VTSMEDAPPPRSEEPRRRRVLGSRVLSVLLAFLLVGITHHLYLEVRHTGLSSVLGDLRDEAAGNTRYRYLNPATEQLVADLAVGDWSCTLVPLKGTRIALTAAHCLVDDQGRRHPGPVSVRYRSDGEVRDLTLVNERILLHPRYVAARQRAAEPPLQQILRSAFTWDTIRGASNARSPYTWDAAAIVTPNLRWEIGVDGIAEESAGPFSIDVYQHYTTTGQPVCTLTVEQNCPLGTAPGPSVEVSVRRGVRCEPPISPRPADADAWVPCALMPGASGGAVTVQRDGRVLLVGLLTGGDDWARGNVVTLGAARDLARAAIAART